MMANQPAMVSSATLKGRIDFGIITIREDEFAAVLERFPPRWLITDGEQQYNVASIERNSDTPLYVAVIRTPEPGHSDAQSAAHHFLSELDPSCLVLVGIAGAKPESEFTLGDVVARTRLHDFSQTAALPGGKTEIYVRGGPTHRLVQSALVVRTRHLVPSE
jgi:hypothetical protein